MTIDCSAAAFVIRLGWILHLNHFIIYVPNSCQCHLEAVWLVIHHTLSFTVVINIVMEWTFSMKLSGGRECRSPVGGSGNWTQESTEGRLSGVLATRRTPEMSLAQPLSLLFSSFRSSFSLLSGFTAALIFIQYTTSRKTTSDPFIDLILQGLSHHLPITLAACRRINTQCHIRT